MSISRVLTRPAGHEALGAALLTGLPAARRARRPRHVRAPTTDKPNCHDAVDAWLGSHSGALAVRGWLAHEMDDGTTTFYAHSLVRDVDGTLLDPTFSVLDPSLLFVPHPREAGSFFACVCVPNPPHALQVSAEPELTVNSPARPGPTKT
ncbi:hypothetical protein [Burkholderia gladioli]|uniref:hypothetical protein n=1 Tax=Burkholderia gladioli TaxID=28095 RepID=UPI001364CC41|nr:hypothetical protein [Burkholderia gladioli]KAF1060751.1 hypothetical protein LvStA_04026 [Burkholderia gladioli]